MKQHVQNVIRILLTNLIILILALERQKKKENIWKTRRNQKYVSIICFANGNILIKINCILLKYIFYKKGSLIADDAMIEEVEEGDFESEAEEADTAESDSGSSTEAEEENDSEGESRATGEMTYNSDSDDSVDLVNLEMQKNMQRFGLDGLQKLEDTGNEIEN